MWPDEVARSATAGILCDEKYRLRRKASVSRTINDEASDDVRRSESWALNKSSFSLRADNCILVHSDVWYNANILLRKYLFYGLFLSTCISRDEPCENIRGTNT